MTWPPDGLGRSATQRRGGIGPGPGLPGGSPDGQLPGPRQPPTSTRRRVAIMVAALASVLVLAASCGGWLVLRYYDGKVHRVPLTFSPSVRRPAAAGGGTQNILMVGSDSRAGTGGEFGEVEGQRSDTTILVHLDADGSTTLVSFPRDLWVTIPGYTDSSGRGHASQKAKLNAAFALGGPSLLMATLETLTKIRIDHYLQIDFIGFQRMTDALGGVTVCVKPLPGGSTSNLDDRMSGWHGHVGDNVLNGEQALAFVRQRYGLPEGDLDRIRRQQQFIGVVFRSATSTSTLTSPAKLTSFLDAATSSITVDDGTSLADLQPLAVRLHGIGTPGVRFTTVPASPGQLGGQSVLLTDPNKLAAFLADLGAAPPTASASLPNIVSVSAVEPAALTAVMAPVAARAPATIRTSPATKAPLTTKAPGAATAPGAGAAGSCTY